MKAKVSLSTLKREARARNRSATRKKSASKAASTRKANKKTPPSKLEALSKWGGKDLDEWNGADLLGYYATVYLDETGSEDAELVSAGARRRCIATMKQILDLLSDDESARDYVDFAVAHCLRGRGYPADNVPSVGALRYRAIVLKKWRTSSTAEPRRRGRNWEEG